MASEQHVKEYLAHWLQLGKRVVVSNGKYQCSPGVILQGNRYSPEFERCWSAILAVGGRDCYIEGTEFTIDQLLSPAWDISACARCQVPVGTPVVICDQYLCPCHDLMTWPNTEVPLPRLPINSQHRLIDLRDRLKESSNRDSGHDSSNAPEP